MKIYSVVSIVVGAMIVIIGSSAYTAIPIDPSVPPDYPGVAADGSIISIASVQMGYAPQAFYKMHGRWPYSWGEITNEGLVQVDLTAATGEYIDPDDASLDFVRDRVYIAPSSAGEPAEQQVLFPGGSSAYEYEAPLTYAEFFDMAGDYSYLYPDPGMEPDYSALAGDMQRLQQFAIASVINGGLRALYMIHGRFPYDFDEFLVSGIGNIDYDSTNPLTGDRFYGDGRPNDYLYVIRNETLAEVVPTDENGDTPWQFTM